MDGIAVDVVERRRRVARSIQRRMVAHLAAGGTTDFAPAPLENDPAAYTDPARAELETRELFLKLPLVAGLSQDVALPGDRQLFEEVGRSVIIARGDDGHLRGFLNMCAHRGSKLLRADPGRGCERRGRLTCPFHAWTYDLDGALVGVPGRQGFDGIDLTRRHLVPVPVAERHGLVFARLVAGGEPLDAAAHLGAFGPELEQLELAGCAKVRSSSLTAGCNWKLALDTYAEGYHFASLHASTIGVSHFSNVAVFDGFAPHWRINFPEKGAAALVGRPEAEWPEPDYGGIHFVFPNTILVAGAGFVRMFRVFPGPTAGAMSCRIDVYAPGGLRSEADRARFTGDDAASDITREDYGVAVDEHANMLHAPAGFRVVYGRNEPALQALHRAIAAVIGVPL